MRPCFAEPDDRDTRNSSWLNVFIEEPVKKLNTPLNCLDWVEFSHPRAHAPDFIMQSLRKNLNFKNWTKSFVRISGHSICSRKPFHVKSISFLSCVKQINFDVNKVSHETFFCLFTQGKKILFFRETSCAHRMARCT